MQMNELQHQSLIKIQNLLKECHHFDLLIRINGENRLIEADFLKELILSIPVYDKPKKKDEYGKNVNICFKKDIFEGIGY